MLNNYLPDDICKIIRNKVSLDFVKYRFWCNVESKWIYVWTEYDLTNSCPCCLSDISDIHSRFTRIISKIPAKGKILKLEKSTVICSTVSSSEFIIVDI